VLADLVILAMLCGVSGMHVVSLAFTLMPPSSPVCPASQP
jgi:hypothetical protein